MSRFENYANITLNSMTTDSQTAFSYFGLNGIPYASSYTFAGIYLNDVNLGKYLIKSNSFVFMCFIN